jgi:hypothetical protein
MSDVQIAVIDQQDTQIVLAVPGVQGATGSSIPSGGTADQVLRKNSSTNYDANWTQVTSAMIADGTIVNADINNGAAIAGTKISPDFGGQAVSTTGQVNAARVNVTANTIPSNGIYLPASNTVGVATNGTGRLFVDASGNVGVGITPTSLGTNVSTLEIKGSAANRSGGLSLTSSDASANAFFYIFDDVGFLGTTSTPLSVFANGAERLRITSAGLVGVGTSGPSYLLDVAGSARIKTGATGTPFIVSTGGDSQGTLRFGSTGAEYSINSGADYLGMIFNVNGNERARIDSDGRLLVGTSTARSPLTHTPSIQVEGLGYETSTVSVITNSNDTNGAYSFIGKSRGTSLGSNTIVQSNDEIGGLDFIAADGTQLLRAARITALVDGTPGANDMPGRLVFSTTADGASSPTERMRISSDAYVRLAAGTGGIQFNGDTAAANALDDYEEGTFEPTIEGSTAAGSGTYANRVGAYTKIGNSVFFRVYVIWSGHTGTGDLQLSGLPFASNSASGRFSAVNVGSVSDVALTANNVFPGGYVATNSSRVVFVQTPVGGGTATAVPFDSAGNLILSGHYTV